MHGKTQSKAGKEMTDQERFDQEVAKKGKVVLQALAGLGIFGALLISIVALNNSSEKHEASAEAKPAVTRAANATPAAATTTKPAANPKVVDVKIAGGVKLGPDGKKHDTYSVTDFNVTAGQPVTLKIDNTDDAPHSISSPAAGVNIIATPGTHTYSLLIAKAGKYQWYCMLPCDSDAGGWAMQHPGYMSGYITAT
ncbi:MAG TPA: cupredoxin domain-containing protein [Solirubrobacteraceae bacterium]